MEARCIPIRLIISGRRLNYLHNILEKDPSDLIKKVYEGQKQNGLREIG